MTSIVAGIMFYYGLGATFMGQSNFVLILSFVVLVIGFSSLSVSAPLLSQARTVDFFSERSTSAAPVVFLRSFCDDEIGLGLMGFKLLDGRIYLRSFEQMISDLFAVVGPLVAIDNPGEELPEQGAQRLCANKFDWQERIEALMESARFVVIMVGGTPGLAWEIQTVMQGPHLEKTILVFPPFQRKELADRWAFFLDLQSQIRVVSCPESLPDFPLFAFFCRMTDRDWKCTIVEGSGNWPRHYLEGFETLMARMRSLDDIRTFG